MINALVGLPNVVDFKEEIHLGGPHVQVIFDNGYGVSVVQNPMSYGLELAVLHGDNADEADLCYATPITNDVIGWIPSPDKLQSIVQEVIALPSNPDCGHNSEW